MSLASLEVILRPNTSMKSAVHPDNIFEGEGRIFPKVRFHTVSHLTDISSSKVRQTRPWLGSFMDAHSESASQNLHPEVVNYIREHRLYDNYS